MSKLWKDIIYLVDEKFDNDEYGVRRQTKTRRKVRANKTGTYASEYTAAGQNDIKITDFMFVIRERQYKGEKIAEYQGKEYGIYRTYPPADDLIELHLVERAGI